MIDVEEKYAFGPDSVKEVPCQFLLPWWLVCLKKEETQQLLKQAIKDEDMCKIWEILNKCRVPCSARWAAIKEAYRCDPAHPPHFW